MFLLCALVVGSSAWANEGDELAICQGTGSGYGTRRTLTDSHSVEWVLSTGQSGFLGTNSSTNHDKVKPTAADLPVVKAVKSDASTSTTGYYFYYTTTAVANVGSIEFSYTANQGNSNATAYVVVGDAVSASNGTAYEIIPLASTSTTAQNASLGTSGTFTYKFNATQTSARYYGFIIVTSSTKRLTGGTIKLLEGVADGENQVKIPSITVPAGPFVSKKTVTISTETDGATIYYTTNGDEPTDASTEYTAAFDITATTTVKAIAVKSGMTDSRLASATFTKETVLTGLSGLNVATTDGTATQRYVNLTSAQVTYASGTTGYIEEATNGFYINGATVTLNKVYNGIFALTSRLFYGNPQIQAIEAVDGEGTITDGETKAATETTLSTLEDDDNFNANLGRKLKVSGVLVSSGQKMGSINLNDLGSNSITVGKGYDFVGYPSKYNSTKRFNVVSATKVAIAPTIDVEDASVAYGKTFTVDESKISGGAITVTSGNTAVATVSGLVITPVAVGEVTITVETAAVDDEFTAGSNTFKLTVTAPTGSTTKPSSYDVKELDFTTNSEWEFPVGSSNKTTTKNSYTSGDYTITLEGGGSGNGYYYNSDGYLIMGKSGATLTLPAFSGDVAKIEVCGRSGASSSVGQNIYVGTTPVSQATTGATSDKTYEIDENYKAAGNIYSLKVTNAYNTQITKIKVYVEKAMPSITATLNGSGYATFCSEYPLDFSDYETADYSAWQITGVSGTTITFSQIEGSVKGGTGILLKGTAGETVTLTSVNSDTDISSTNKLVGTLAPTYVLDYSYYGLSGDKFKNVNAGTVKAGKALLPAVEVDGGNARQLTFIFEGTQGISTVEHTTLSTDDAIYSISGQRVSTPKKGLYIMNGKKVLVK